MRKTIFVLCLALLAASCDKTSSPISPAYNYNTPLEIGSQTLTVEIATSPEAMQQGLSDRISMGKNQGMLFDFGAVPVNTSFWMKDMRFNLDFIWIEQNKIVGITPDVPAPTHLNTNLPSYYPPSPVNQVLEVNAGWAKENNSKSGDEVKLVN